MARTCEVEAVPVCHGPVVQQAVLVIDCDGAEDVGEDALVGEVHDDAALPPRNAACFEHVPSSGR